MAFVALLTLIATPGLASAQQNAVEQFEQAPGDAIQQGAGEQFQQAGEEERFPQNAGTPAEPGADELASPGADEQAEPAFEEQVPQTAAEDAGQITPEDATAPVEVETAAEEGTADLVNPNPLSTLSLESLTATRSLPLFTPSRTPPPVEAPVEAELVEAAPPEPESEPDAVPPPLELIGIVLTDTTQTALLRNSATGEMLRLHSGEKLEDWELKIVDGRSVELSKGDRMQSLKMFEVFPVSAVAPADQYQQGIFPQQQQQGQNPEDGSQPPMLEEFPPIGTQRSQSGQDAQTMELQPADGSSVDFSDGNFAPDLGDGPIPEEGQPAPDQGFGANQ